MTTIEEHSTERILVVDDDPMVCDLLSEFLSLEGYETIVCKDAGDALMSTEGRTFGMAFVDINLPDMNGLELAARLKESVPEREVVFVTGSGTVDNAVQAIKVGAYDYLRKPFSLGELSLCLKRFQERKMLRRQIRLAEQRYTDLVQNIPLLIYVLRRDFRVDFVNQTCSAILGYTPEEAVSDPHWFLDRIHSEDRDRITKLLRASFEPGGPPFSAESRLIHKNGHLINAIVKSIPAYGSEEDHGTERLEGIIVDITDRVFLERALVQKEKLKTLGAISAEVAHEIRNPLVAIGGFARRLKKKASDLPEVDIILRESQRLEKILGRIANYLKPVETRCEECSLNAVVAECLDLLSPEIEQKAVAIRLDLHPKQPEACGDRDILSQACINLIRNAIKSMGKGGHLTVKSYESDQNAHLDFKSLIERPIKDPELLFLPFDEGGHYLGLALSYRLLKSIGGLLSFAQQEREAVFTISLPKPPCSSCETLPAASCDRIEHNPAE